MCVYRQPVVSTPSSVSDAAWTSTPLSVGRRHRRPLRRTGRNDLGLGLLPGSVNLKLGVIASKPSPTAPWPARPDGAERAAEATAEFIAAGLRQLG